MKVLITGGAGFIGSRLVLQLLDQSCHCAVVDNLASGCPPPKAHKNLEFYRQDILESDRFRATLLRFQPHTVVHLAAVHHIPTCERNSPAALQVNVVGFQIVLDAAREAGCPRVILASSGAVYDWREGPLREDETPVVPYDIYSLSKITNEHQLRLWTLRTGATAVVARIFNTIGKNDPNAHLIPDILQQLNGSPSVIRLGNLHTRRDYVYVDDTAACLAAMVEATHLSGITVLNVGSGTESDVRAVVECIGRIRNVPVEVHSDANRIRAVDRLHQLADLAKTRSLLGWRPRHTLEEALRLTLET